MGIRGRPGGVAARGARGNRVGVSDEQQRQICRARRARKSRVVARRAAPSRRIESGSASKATGYTRPYCWRRAAPRRALPEEDASHLRLDPVGVQRRIGHGLDGRDGRGARRVPTAHPGVQGRGPAGHDCRPGTANPARSSNQVSRGSTTGMGAAGSFSAAKVGSPGTPIRPTSRNSR